MLSLVTVPGGEPPIASAEFLRLIGAADGQELGLRLLRDATGRKDLVDVEMALVVTAVFGVTADHLEPLLALAWADWHVKHEDVVTELRKLRSPAAVDALYHASWWVPEYLEFDENRALAIKAVRALGAIPGEEAEEALRRLLEVETEIVREQASRELDRRPRP